MYQIEKENKGMGKSRILITCAKGITPFLKEELLLLGFPVIAETIAGIATEGTIDDTLRLNLLLRTGHRVLFLIREFAARDAEALYRSVSEIAWEEYIAEDGYVCVTSSVDNPSIRDSRYANVKCKDAIVDRIKEKCGQRPDSGPDQDRVVVNLYWKDGSCALYFDTSGEPLSPARIQKDPYDSTHAGDPCGCSYPCNRMERQRPFHQSYVRQRHPCHRGCPGRPEQGSRDIKGQFRVHASKGI
jgi:hypothetical protein